MEPAEVVAAVSIVIHLIVLYIQARTKAEMSELKATMYKEFATFATKEDFALILKKAMRIIHDHQRGV